jgi:tetratricopeptide (TPR) repeat protein
VQNNPQKLSLKGTYLYLVLLCLVFPLVYLKLFSAGFISWDDAEYVLDNKDVHDFNLKALFTKFYVGNYHPLSMLSYAINWKLFGKEALGYHIENILWHLLNTILVFVLCKKLFKGEAKAFLVAVIFAFHPTQVESMAWIAERKTLQYAFCFLCGLIAYVNFIERKSWKFMAYTALFFCLSLLYKPSAIVFPFALLCIDLFYDHRLGKQKLLQKLPFLVPSIILGIVTIYAQEAGKFINESHAYPVYERIGFAGYAIMQYAYRYIVPLNLSVIYPYPQDKLVSAVIGYVVILVLMFGCYKLYTTKRYSILTGLLFFMVNLLLVLQFVPFGEALTADRYMYLPVMGLSIAVISVISLTEKRMKMISVVLIVILGGLSFMRAGVWQNSSALYTDILKKYPHSSTALNSLGAEYMLNRNYDQAIRYFNKAVGEDVNNHKSYYNRGLLYAQNGKFNEALADFNKAIALKQYPKAYVARANVYYMLKDFSKAMSDAETILKTEPNNVKANFVVANCYDDLNQLDKAMGYYNKVIALNTSDPSFYLRRAIVYGKLKQFDQCLKDLDASTAINVNYGEAYFWKGVVKVNMNQNPCDDLKKALNLGYTAAGGPLAKYCR